MPLPPKRKRPRSGIERGPQRVWPRHERYVRSFDCAVIGDVEHDGRIQLAHVRLGGKAGTGIKPPSWQTIPLCCGHHAEQHQIGHKRFDAKYHLDSLKMAFDLAHSSPDFKMKEAMRESEK